MLEQPSSRKAELVDLELYSQYRNCESWAIIVGISQYEHRSWNLKYADRDAEDLYKLLLTPNGGDFKKDHICKLINEEATTSNITRALRSFLKKPAREDLVFIYFACHGSPDFDRPSNVYLLTYNTNPEDVAGTALPMREIDLALRENLLAEKIIVLADTCHSAAIGGGIGRRGAVDSSTIVNRYLQEVSRANGGIALLTSAETNEVSFEDAKWGGGHGVFTFYLLEGMRGAADLDQNGIVTVGELFEYVRDNVKSQTNYRQHPSIGTNAYDRNLPVAINSSIVISDLEPDISQPDGPLLNYSPGRNPSSWGLSHALIGMGFVMIVLSGLFIFFQKPLPNLQESNSNSEQPTPNKDSKSLTVEELTPEITACRTKDKVRELDRQIFFIIQTLYPDALVSFTDLNVEFNEAGSFPLLQPEAKAALQKAINRRGKKLIINSAYRSITSQQIFRNYAKTGGCGITAAARPGKSRHQDGLAIDIEDYESWQSYLEAAGWRWGGERDRPHFQYDGSDVTDISHLPIIAFQRLWNLNHPESPLPENGIFDPETEKRLNQSPINGFPEGGKVFN